MCETWSLTLGEEHRPGVIENIVLRNIVRPEMDKVVENWRRLHSADLHGMCCFATCYPGDLIKKCHGPCGTY